MRGTGNQPVDSLQMWANPHGIHASTLDGDDAGLSILYADGTFRADAQAGTGRQENLRMGLGMGQLGRIGTIVKRVGQTEGGQHLGGILRHGGEPDAKAVLAQALQQCPDPRQDIRW
ncbi:hypothetical protein D3C84_673140 [compost metagenome]